MLKVYEITTPKNINRKGVLKSECKYLLCLMLRIWVICKWGSLYEKSNFNLSKYSVHFDSRYKEERN